MALFSGGSWDQFGPIVEPEPRPGTSFADFMSSVRPVRSCLFFVPTEHCAKVSLERRLRRQGVDFGPKKHALEDHFCMIFSDLFKTDESVL